MEFAFLQKSLAGSRRLRSSTSSLLSASHVDAYLGWMGFLRVFDFANLVAGFSLLVQPANTRGLVTGVRAGVTFYTRGRQW